MTTTPNRFVGKIHERQPEIIDRKDYAQWLDPKTPTDEITDMVKAIDDGPLEAWPVSDTAKSSESKGEHLLRFLADSRAR
jgi:putative SOS response-associated peptidase YedK